MLSLTLFVLWIFFVDYVETTLATNDFGVGGAFFNGCSYFHFLLVFCLVLFVTESNAAFCEVVGRHFDAHFVAGKDFDVVHPHFTGDVCGDFVPVLELDAKHCVAQSLDDCTVLFDC